MASFHDYWLGYKKASLSFDTVARKWGSRGTSYSLVALGFCNRCFDIFYQARQTISDWDEPYSSKMKKKLEDAANEGWGFGVSDLKESFQHLADTGGIWKDDNVENYYGGRHKIFAKGSLIKAPEGIVNFADAVDSKMKHLRSGIEFYNAKLAELAEARKADDWAKVGTLLGEVKSRAEKIAPFLWTAPKYQTVLQKTASYSGTLSKIWTGLNMYATAARADAGYTEALAIMRTAVEFVPVLGGFYGSAIEMIPGLEREMKKAIDRRVRILDDASRGTIMPHGGR